MRSDRPERPDRTAVSAGSAARSRDSAPTTAAGGWAAGLAAVLALLLTTVGAAGGQEVVSSRVALSSAEASIQVELSTGEPLEIVFRDGEVLVEGERVGSYEEGASLESAWRELLGEAAGRPPARLSAVLRDWSPPSGLEEESRRVAERIDATLDERIGPGAPTAGAAPAAGPDLDDLEGLEGLLLRPARLRQLAAAVDGLDLGNVDVRVGEGLTVPPGEEQDGSVILVDGDLEVEGTLRGDAVVVGGTLRLGDEGRITGDVRLSEAEIERDGGTIDGSVTPVELPRPDAPETTATSPEPSPDAERNLRDAVRDELRAEFGDRARGRSSGSAAFSALRNVGSGLLGLFQNLIGLAIALALSALVVRFAPDHLDRVTDAARSVPGRSAVVGVAGGFLVLPAYVLGMLALCLSIIGIPALLLWIPLFPLAASLAAAFGYLAVARLLGEWITRQRFQNLRFLRPSNTLHCLAAGLAALILPFAAAHVVEIGGNWLDVLRGLLIGIGWLAGFGAVMVGFGALLLTRGGRVRAGGGAGPAAPGEGFDAPPAGPPPGEGPPDPRSEGAPGGGPSGAPESSPRDREAGAEESQGPDVADRDDTDDGERNSTGGRSTSDV